MQNSKREELVYQKKRAGEIKVDLCPDYITNRYREHKNWRLFHKELVFKEIGNFKLLREKVIAYVSDMHLDIDKPIYSAEDISGIINFIEDYRRRA